MTEFWDAAAGWAGQTALTGGVLLLGEPLRARLVIAGVIVLGGIALAMLAPPGPSARRRGAQASLDASTDSRANWPSQIERTRSKVSASAGLLSGR